MIFLKFLRKEHEIPHCTAALHPTRRLNAGRISKRIKRLKRVKDIIKHKGRQKSARIKKMLKNIRFS